MIAAVVALIGGGAAGVFAIGPMLKGSGGEAKAAATDDHGDSGGEAKKKKGGHGKSDAGNQTLYTVDNLVVNPAGTQGTRFLIATVAAELKSNDAVTSLQERDPEVRDELLNLLSARTVEQLSDLGGRDILKDEIKQAIEKIVGAGKVVRVFIPQYVLQ